MKFSNIVNKILNAKFEAECFKYRWPNLLEVFFLGSAETM